MPSTLGRAATTMKKYPLGVETTLTWEAAHTHTHTHKHGRRTLHELILNMNRGCSL